MAIYSVLPRGLPFVRAALCPGASFADSAWPRPCSISDLTSLPRFRSLVFDPFLEQDKTRSLSDSRAPVLTTEDLKITRIQKLEKPLHHVTRVARRPLLAAPLRPPLCLDHTGVGRIFTVYTYIREATRSLLGCFFLSLFE